LKKKNDNKKQISSSRYLTSKMIDLEFLHNIKKNTSQITQNKNNKLMLNKI